MCYLYTMKRSMRLFSKFRRISCVLDGGTSLSIVKSMKIFEQHVSWFSSLESNSHESAQVSEWSENEQILHCLNTLTAEQMRNEKNVSFTMSELICKHREANGLFSSVKDIEKIKRMGPKSIRIICDKFSAKTSDIKQKNVVDEDSVLKFISPELTPSFIESISSVTTLEVCLDSVFFSTLSRDMQVKDWNHVTLLGSNHQKQMPAQILDQAVHVLHHVPKTSIILMENRLSRKISPNYLQYLLFIGRLQMALQTLLNEDLSTSGQHKVFHIKDSFVIKTFNLHVGGERVSGQNCIQEIQDGQISQRVSVAPNFWQRYNRLESDIFKERYANCFLMSLPFCQYFFGNRPVNHKDNSIVANHA